MHIRHLDVADRAAGRERLKLRLEGQLAECVDMLGHMDVVAVGDVALVRDAGDDAEALLQALGELVRRGLQRRAVEAEVDVVHLLPLGAGVVHVLHDLERERRGRGVGVRLAGHVLDALIQSRVAEGDGRVAAVEELVDRLALFQARQRTVLPQDGRGVRERALEPLVAAHERAVAELEPLVKDLPELLHVAAGGQRHIRQVDGHDALIEAAVVLRLSVFVDIRRQEAAAAHAGVAVALAVFVDLELEHLLLGDVVRHHALGGAAGGQLREIPVGGILVDVVLLEHVNELRERRRDPHALLVFHALIALAQRLLDDHGEVMALLLVFRLSEIHEHRHERGLAVRGQQRDDLILDRLHAAADLLAHAVFDELGQLFLTRMRVDGLHFGLDLAADALAADLHERGQMRQRDRLPAVLVGGDLRDDLGRNVARGREAVRPLDERAGDDRAVFEHIFQVHEVAVVHVLRVIVRVVEVDDTLLVRLDNVLRQQEAARDVTADLAGHVVALRAVDDRILVGVFLLGLFVVALDEAQDAVVGRVGAAHQAAGVAVSNVGLGDLERTVGHDLLFDHVLNFLHGGAAAQLLAGELHALGDALDLPRRHAVALFDGGIGLRDGHDDLGDVKVLLCAVSLDDLHLSVPPPRNRKHNILCGKPLYFVLRAGISYNI